MNTPSRICAIILLIVGSVYALNSSSNGPENEKRFPPLKIPAGFKATLYACDPMIEYPSAIALGPKRGSLFVAIDYMTGLGTKIIRRDEIRLLQDTNGDDYADKATVYAKGFNSIEGMTFHDGVVYVMHAPYLTALCDTNGDGKADERRDLLDGLGLPPEKNPVRLHCANGLVMGHDGWLYLALGDHGCDVKRPEGDRLIHNGGAILRCRADGRDLHVFSYGLRNIYDVALDAELNVFVRDNENDGGRYMVRVCHSFFGADHGYPYLYKDRPDEALPPLADLGRGSSAGGLCYLENNFPPAYRGNLFFCEWGRAVVRCAPKKSGSAFAKLSESDFAYGVANDPYGFKPTDLVVDYDGALFVADWCDGQRPKRGRGRIYRITALDAKKQPKPKADPVANLNSPSFLQRMKAQTRLMKKGTDGWSLVASAWDSNSLRELGRNHAVWIMARIRGRKCLTRLIKTAWLDPSAMVRLQAIRALADLHDPILSEHKLSANSQPTKFAAILASLAKDQEPIIVREIVVALGRLQWADSPKWIRDHIKSFDPAMAHAAMQTMRRSKNWRAILSILDDDKSTELRNVALRALAENYEPVVVDSLFERLKTEAVSKRRQQYADLLTRVYKKPKAWEYWGYRPPPRPPNSVAWEKTDAITSALDNVLRDPDLKVRHVILQRMQREQIPVRLATLSDWLQSDHEPNRVATIFDSLRKKPANEIRALLLHVVRSKKHPAGSRLAALKMVASGLDKKSSGLLMKLTAILDDGPVLAQVLKNLIAWPNLAPASLLSKKLDSSDAAVRAAAIHALAELKVQAAAPHVEKLLADKSAEVRIAAAVAVGKLAVKSSSDTLLKLAGMENTELRKACLDSLRQLNDARASSLAVEALKKPGTQLAALRYLHDLGNASHAKFVADLATKNQSMDVLPLAMRTLAKWQKDNSQIERMMANVQGASGMILQWRISGPLSSKAVLSMMTKHATAKTGFPDGKKWKALIASAVDGRISWNAKKTNPEKAWMALSDVFVPKTQNVQVLASGNGRFDIFLDGKTVYRKRAAAAFRTDSDRFEINLAKGMHRVMVIIAPRQKAARFHLRFRRKSSKAEHEKLIQFALSRVGNVTRGRELFFNVKKSQCLKCHRMDQTGEQIGPDLTGIGKRFSRIHLIESILDPSRTIAPSYEAHLVELKDGRVLSGTKIEETKTVLILGDKEGKKIKLPKSMIVTRGVLSQSTMPDGLEQPLTQREFVDLIAFLQSRK